LINNNPFICSRT